MKKLFAVIAALSAACLCLAACGDSYYSPDSGNFYPLGPSINGGDSSLTPDSVGDAGSDESDGSYDDNYNYDNIIEQDFTSVSQQASSYFSLDRNTATYSIVRSQILNGYTVSPYSVRVEEMINYFTYEYSAPDEKAIGITPYLSDCPWNADHKLMAVGLKSTEYELENVNANYVFLIDVSGSMSGDTRLGLAKYGLNLLVDELGDNDLVSIVTYASGVKEVLDGGECTEQGKQLIKNKISGLVASGATNGGDGLERAYRIASEHFITGGNNRVIIISDGDFNVGMTDKTQLKEYIQDKAASGIYLSVLGVGMGNMRDDILETLATCGNGNYAYLDNKTEAEKVFVEELKGTLFTVAKDAKAGVTFTENVDKYRLIGYDAKIISEDDFNNENADTGEIGSNLCVTALYELVLADSAEEKLADVEVKFKDVRGETEINDSVTCEVNLSTPSSDDLKFISCVAEFGLILRKSEYRGTASVTSVLERLDGLSEYVARDIYKQEFVTIVGTASESGKYDYKEVVKIETSWDEGFMAFSRYFLRTFDFTTGSVYDTRVADLEFIPEEDLEQIDFDLYNNPVEIKTFSKSQAQNFLDNVTSLGMFNWAERYVTDDIIDDGGSNSVCIYFSDGTKKNTYIYFEYPPKYDNISTAFEDFLGAEMYLTL